MRPTSCKGRVAAALVLGSLLGATNATPQGWADLHAHPASHLAFGHVPGSTCDAGIFHGFPGDDPVDPTRDWQTHLQPCDPERHSGGCEIVDLAQKAQRTSIISLLEDAWGRHLPNGAPDLSYWPHARSRTHQQMHLAWLRRAWQGGMRLLIASVTDNELLEDWWHDDSWCSGLFRPAPGHDFDSAVEQIQFLEALDLKSNGSPDDWFDIVRSPEEVLDAWTDNKLAVILGVEMDSLTLEEIERLIDDYGVRSIIPVHLADNTLGGSAVYSQLFDTLTHWHNGSHFEVEGDPALSTRLPRPQELTQVSLLPTCSPENPRCLCSIQPKDVSIEAWDALGYEAVDGREGHRNRLGLADPAAIKRLMERGVLLDVAHMSWRATDETLQIAEAFRYPLLDSHTGLRTGCTGDKASERALTVAHAGRIANLGGVIGLGTEGEPGRETLFTHHGNIRLTGSGRDFRTFRGPDVNRTLGQVADELYVRVTTGDDDLRGRNLICGESKAMLLLNTVRGERSFQLSFSHGLAANSVNEMRIYLASTFGGPLPLADIIGVGFELVQGSACASPDNWDLAAYDIVFQGRDARGNPARGLIVERSGAPYRRFTKSVPLFRTTNLASAAPRTESLRRSTVASLELALSLGDDDVRDGLEDGLQLVAVLHDGRRLSEDFKRFTGVPSTFGASRTTATGTWTLPPAITYGDIAAIYLHNRSTGDATSYDNVDVVRGRLRYVDGAGRLRVLANRTAAEFRGTRLTWRLTRNQPDGLLFRGLDPEVAPTPLFSRVEVKVRTGLDDLRYGERAMLVLTFHDGSTERYDLNLRSLWDTNAEKAVILRLDRAVRLDELASAGIFADLSGGLSGDNWNFDSFVVSGLTDPATLWLEELQRTYAAMSLGGQPAIALGTDLNGFQPQMPFVEGTVKSNTLDFLPPEFEIERGDRTFGREFLLEEDGIAHVGMLPDFINHIQSLGDPRSSILLSSAAATYYAWWRATNRRGIVAASGMPPLTEPVSVCLSP